MQVLINKAHNIQYINSILTKNLTKLAEDGSSIWFIISQLFAIIVKNLFGSVKCWDATILAKQID